MPLLLEELVLLVVPLVLLVLVVLVHFVGYLVLLHLFSSLVGSYPNIVFVEQGSVNLYYQSHISPKKKRLTE